MQILSFLTLVVVLTTVNVVAHETATYWESRSIKGGHNAPSYRFYVFITKQYGRSDKGRGCGGVILSENLVLTAAHCLYQYKLRRWASPREIKVVATDFTRKRWQRRPLTSRVRKGVTHSDFDPSDKSGQNDIALLVTKKKLSIKFNYKALAICDDDESYNEAVVIGMGRKNRFPGPPGASLLFPNRFRLVLQQAILYEDPDCESWGDLANNQSQVCFGDDERKSTCKGVSGDVLVADVGTTSQCLLGISTFGSGETCDHHELPTVFTKVSHFQHWVETAVATLDGAASEV